MGTTKRYGGFLGKNPLATVRLGGSGTGFRPFKAFGKTQGQKIKLTLKKKG
jgi:hypothetical protein